MGSGPGKTRIGVLRLTAYRPCLLVLAVRRGGRESLLFVLLFGLWSPVLSDGASHGAQPFTPSGQLRRGRCTSLRHWIGFASHQQDVIVPWYFVRTFLLSLPSTRRAQASRPELNDVNRVAGLRRSHALLRSLTPVPRFYGEPMISVLVFNAIAEI